MKKKDLSQRGLGSQVPAHLNDKPFYENSLSLSSNKSQEKVTEATQTTKDNDLKANIVASTDGRDEIIRNAITDGRVIDFDNKKEMTCQ